MSSSDLIILIFGLIFLLYIFSNKENFNLTNSLGYQIDPLPIENDYGMNYNSNDNMPLINRMKPVLENEKLIRQQGINDFQKESLKSANIVNYYNTPMHIPYDLQRHDYKFEKNPNDVIKEMESKGEPLEMRQIFNNTIKDYSKLNQAEPIIKKLKEQSNKSIGIDQDKFSYFNKSDELKELNDTETIKPFNAVQSSFSKY